MYSLQLCRELIYMQTQTCSYHYRTFLSLLLYDCPERIARLKKNRSIRLCFRSFVPVPTLRVQRSWDGTQKAHLYNQQRGVHMPLYISGPLQKALLHSKKCTACRTSPSRRTGSWIETPPSACVS